MPCAKRTDGLTSALLQERNNLYAVAPTFLSDAMSLVKQSILDSYRPIAVYFVTVMFQIVFRPSISQNSTNSTG